MSIEIILPSAPSASSLLCADAVEKKLYWDRSHYDSPESQMRALAMSSTLYIGNLSFTTRVSHLKALFANLGPVAAINMGLDRFHKTPCGFAFVEYGKREDALNAVAYLTGCKLDGRVIRVELDAGFKPGRQFGRGSSGGQVRDDRCGTGRAGGQKGKPNAGISSNRWQAPQRGSSPNGGPSKGHYGPNGSDSMGGKRSRDSFGDGNQYGERNAKNSRFNEYSDDEN